MRVVTAGEFALCVSVLDGNQLRNLLLQLALHSPFNTLPLVNQIVKQES